MYPFLTFLLHDSEMFLKTNILHSTFFPAVLLTTGAPATQAGPVVTAVSVFAVVFQTVQVMGDVLVQINVNATRAGMD